MECPDLHQNKGKGNFRARIHLSELPTCGRKRPKECSVPTKQQVMITAVNVTEEDKGPSSSELNKKRHRKE